MRNHTERLIAYEAFKHEFKAPCFRQAPSYQSISIGPRLRLIDEEGPKGRPLHDLLSSDCQNYTASTYFDSFHDFCSFRDTPLQLIRALHDYGDAIGNGNGQKSDSKGEDRSLSRREAISQMKRIVRGEEDNNSAKGQSIRIGMKRIPEEAKCLHP